MKPKLSQPQNWSIECQAVFEKLKWLSAAELVLKHPNPDETFVIKRCGSVGGLTPEEKKGGAATLCLHVSWSYGLSLPGGIKGPKEAIP